MVVQGAQVLAAKAKGEQEELVWDVLDNVADDTVPFTVCQITNIRHEHIWSTETLKPFPFPAIELALNLIPQIDSLACPTSQHLIKLKHSSILIR